MRHLLTHISFETFFLEHNSRQKWTSKILQHFTQIIFVTLALVACNNKNNIDKPKDVVWDRENCTHCHMSISDHRYAAQIRDANNKTYFFDDAGCAIEWSESHPEKKIHKFWVMDKSKQNWLPASSSHWTSGNQTPMGYGFAASSVKSAESVTFSEVTDRIKQKLQTKKQQHK